MLLGRHEEFAAHETGSWHPERAERLEAVFGGIEDSPAAALTVAFEPRRATREELEIVHEPSYIELIEDHCLSGGGHLDEDTVAAPASFDAALQSSGCRSGRRRAAAQRRRRQCLSRRAAAGTPRPGGAGDGLLPVQQRRRHGRACSPRKASG